MPYYESLHVDKIIKHLETPGGHVVSDEKLNRESDKKRRFVYEY